MYFPLELKANQNEVELANRSFIQINWRNNWKQAQEKCKPEKSMTPWGSQLLYLTKSITKINEIIESLAT